VGLYTASAILSIAHDRPLPVVDGNVRRVLARLLALRGPRWRADGPFYEQADELLDRDHPGDWNQALMELGATVCTPRGPACPACPLRRDCLALERGLVAELPEGRSRRAPVDVTVAAAVVERAGKMLLVRRAEGRLMGRMWEIPQTSLESRGHPDLVRDVEQKDGLQIEVQGLVGRARHAITFRRIRVEAYRARLRRTPPANPDRYAWVAAADADALPISSLTRKVLRALRAPQLPLALAEEIG
jgi:A/G-specific adenine glycosylase